MENLDSPLINDDNCPWNLIIVNQIPKNVEREELLSIFSEYGSIQDMYLPTETNTCGDIMPDASVKTTKGNHEKTSENFARITFNNEVDARSVWQAAQDGLIKYNDHKLMITLVSNDYSPIENLPRDCLKEIFLRLYDITDKMNVELVTKRWNAIAKTAWSNITKLDHPDCEKIVILRTKNILKNVTISIQGIMKSPLELLAEHCTSIEVFYCTFSWVDMSKHLDQLRTVLERNENLRSVYLSFYQMEYRNDLKITDALPSSLKHFEIDSTDALIVFANPIDISHLHNLEVLILLDLDLSGIEITGIENLVNLRKFKINSSEIDPRNIAKMTHLENLEHFSIPHCQVSNEVLSDILRNNMKLKYLDISYIEDLTDRAFKYVQWLPELQVLIMNGLSLITDKYLRNMPTLKALAIRNCDAITDAGVKRFLDDACDIEIIHAAYTCITMESLLAAREWTLRTNKRLTVFVIPDFFFHEPDERTIGASGLLNVITWSRYSSLPNETSKDDGWSEQLADTIHL